MTNNKFKVWCKEHNEWEKDEVIITTNGQLMHLLNESVVPLRTIPLRSATHAVCKSTGRVDKNGSEIFTHDIVFDGVSNRIILNSMSGNCEIMACPLGDSSIRLGMKHHNIFEIVGNEFSHPELMKNGTI